MRRLVVTPLAFLFVVLSLNFAVKPEPPYKDGDLIFIINPSGQGKAIQLATKSKFTHVGIVFIENGKAMIYHAVEPVSKNTVQEFIAMSVDGNYEVKRLKNQTLLSRNVVNQMLTEAKSKIGVPYDLVFSWDDTELYCSEFVWKLYNHALHIAIGDLKPLKSFDLEHPIVKAKLQQRYGNAIPYNENMISPGDIFNSPFLQ